MSPTKLTDSYFAALRPEFRTDSNEELSMTCLFITIRVAGVSSKLSASEIENHLEQGKKLLAVGQLSDALGHYHAAVGKWNLLQEYRLKLV